MGRLGGVDTDHPGKGISHGSSPTRGMMRKIKDPSPCFCDIQIQFASNVVSTCDLVR